MLCLFRFQWSAIESVYFCHETLTTIGFGDYFPQTSWGQAALVVFAGGGLNTVAMLLTMLLTAAEGQEAGAGAKADADVQERSSERDVRRRLLCVWCGRKSSVLS